MPATDWAARAEKAELADLERLWETLDIPDRRVEFLDGQIVVSPTASLWHYSQRRDRVAKLRACGQGRVPLYLLIDQLADPAAVTLFSDPEESSYRTCTPATAGQALRLPEPFGISLDIRRLLG
jgi:hypothetical protein